MQTSQENKNKGYEIMKDYIIFLPSKNRRRKTYIVSARNETEAARKYSPKLRGCNPKKYGHGKLCYIVREFFGWSYPRELYGARRAILGESRAQYYIYEGA